MAANTTRHLRRMAVLGIGAAAMLALAVTAGCGPSWYKSGSGQSESGDAPAGGATTTAQEVLDALVAAYQGAQSYQDSGRVRLQFSYDGKQIDEEADFAITLARPNKLRMHCYQATVLSDGKQVTAQIAELQDQVLQQPVPDPFTPDAIYGLDENLGAVLTRGLAGASPQLALLLEPDPLKRLLAGTTGDPKLLPPAELDGVLCDRVDIPTEVGSLVFWIRRDGPVLLRIDFPGEPVAQMFPPDRAVQEVKLWVELAGAKLNPALDDGLFEAVVPEGVKTVANFELQAPPSPTDLLGEQIAEFTFTTTDQQQVTRDDLKDQVVVIDFWATWCQPCVLSLPKLHEVYQKFQDNPKVRFLAVSVDEPSVGTEQLQQMFQRLEVKVPIARDLQGAFNGVFKGSGIPCLVVLGPGGIVQDAEMGYNPNLESELPQRLEKLLAGEDLYPLAKARHQQQVGGEAGQAAPTNVEIAPRSQPQHFKLVELWTADTPAPAGNLLVVRDGEETKIVVLKDFDRVVELSPDGQTLGEHRLDLPGGSAVTFLRTAVDGQGERYYLGSAGAQPQVHLFNAQWEHVQSWPQQEKLEVFDALLADLNRDGSLEMVVGTWDRGIWAVSPAGETLWHHDEYRNVLSLAAGGPDDEGRATIFVTHQEGSLGRIDTAGKSLGSTAVDGRFVRLLFRGPANASGQFPLCGIAPMADGSETALGLSPEGKEMWAYALPRGLHTHPIEMAACGFLTDGYRPVWVLAAADGSLHFVSAEGQLMDKFRYGEALTGLAVDLLPPHRVLLVSTPRGVSAWGVQMPDTQSPAEESPRGEAPSTKEPPDTEEAPGAEEAPLLSPPSPDDSESSPPAEDDPADE